MKFPDSPMPSSAHKTRDDNEYIRLDATRDFRRACSDAASAVYAAIVAILVWMYVLVFPDRHATARASVKSGLLVVGRLFSIPWSLVSTVGRWMYEWFVICVGFLSLLRYGPGEVSPRKLWTSVMHQFRTDSVGAKLAWMVVLAFTFVFVRGWIRTYHIPTIVHVNCDEVLSSLPPDVCGSLVGDGSLCVRGPQHSLYLSRWFIHLTSGRVVTLMEHASICPEVTHQRARFSHVEVMNGTNVVAVENSAAFCIQHWRDVLGGNWVC